MAVTARPAGRKRLRSVRCPDCKAPRTVSLEQALRIERGVHSAKCTLCRNPPKSKPVEECDRRWWLTQAGVSRAAIQQAGGASAYVRTHGLPPELQPIAASAAYFTS